MPKIGSPFDPALISLAVQKQLAEKSRGLDYANLQSRHALAQQEGQRQRDLMAAELDARRRAAEQEMQFGIANREDQQAFEAEQAGLSRQASQDAAARQEAFQREQFQYGQEQDVYTRDRNERLDEEGKRRWEAEQSLDEKKAEDMATTKAASEETKRLKEIINQVRQFGGIVLEPDGQGGYKLADGSSLTGEGSEAAKRAAQTTTEAARTEMYKSRAEEAMSRIPLNQVRAAATEHAMRLSEIASKVKTKRDAFNTGLEVWKIFKDPTFGGITQTDPDTGEVRSMTPNEVRTAAAAMGEFIASTFPDTPEGRMLADEMIRGYQEEGRRFSKDMNEQFRFGNPGYGTGSAESSPQAPAPKGDQALNKWGDAINEQRKRAREALTGQR